VSSFGFIAESYRLCLHGAIRWSHLDRIARNVSLAPSFRLRTTEKVRNIMENRDKDSTGSDTNGQGVSKPSEGQTQGRTPQGGGQNRGGGDGGKTGGRDSSQDGGQNDD
jgi:hypothetical protein